MSSACQSVIVSSSVSRCWLVGLSLSAHQSVVVSLSARRSIVTSSSVGHHLLVSCRLLISRSSSRCWSSSHRWSSSHCWSSSCRQSSSRRRLSSCHQLLSVIISCCRSSSVIISRCRSSVVLGSSSIIVCHRRSLLVIVIHHRRQLSSTVIISHRPPSSSVVVHTDRRVPDHVTLAPPSTTRHVSLSPQRPHTPRLLLVPLLLRPSSDALLQLQRRSHLPTDWESSPTSLAAPAVVGQRHKTAPTNCQSMPHTSSSTLHYSALVRAHELLDV